MRLISKYTNLFLAIAQADACANLTNYNLAPMWGQKVFSTNDMKAGWNGSFKGSQSNAGSYVWVLKATDVVGKPFDLKGSFVLIR